MNDARRFGGRLLCVWLILASTPLRADWPTYQHDFARSGATDEELALPLSEIWRYTAPRPPAPAWPPPAAQDFWHHKTDLPARVVFDRAFHLVSDGKSVYFGSSSDDQIRSLDLQEGALRWTYFCEGPIRLAPTLAHGDLFVGSDDGCVYCLRAESGELVWKRPARQIERRIPGNGRMISVWPVRSGVIVQEGQVRFASGLFPLQGTFQHVLRESDGAAIAEGPLNFSPQGYLELRGKRLVVPQGRSKPTLVAALNGLAAADESKAAEAVTSNPLATIRAGATRFVGQDDQVIAIDSEGKTIWRQAVDGRAYSLAVAGQSLLVSTDRGVIHCFQHPGSEPQRSGRRVGAEPALSNPSLTGAEHEPILDSSTAGEIGELLEAEGLENGYALVVGEPAVETAMAVSARSRLQVVGVVDAAHLVRDRAALTEQGLYGRVVLHEKRAAPLPYGSGLFNLIVLHRGVDASMSSEALGEILRLLRPGAGLALIEIASTADTDRSDGLSWTAMIPEDTFSVEAQGRWWQIRRKELAGIGEWTHMYGSPSNTACSDDKVVGKDLKLQWFGPPGPRQMVDRHHRTVPPLYSAGRLFIPGNDRVYAVDAYNGSPLWDTAVSKFRRVGVMRDSGSMAASPDYLYVVAGDRCYGLGAATGSYDLNFTVPESLERRDWGYLAHVGQLLVGSTTRLDASRGGHSREQIGETYLDFVPIVTSDGLFCVDRHSGDSKWQYRAVGGAIVNPTITIADNRIFFVESANRETLAEPTGRSALQALVGTACNLVALDLSTGEPVWRAGVDLSAIQHHLYLCHTEGKLIAVGSKNKKVGQREFVWYDLHAFDASDGSPIWSATQNQRQVTNGDHGEQDHHPAVVGGVVYQEPYAYDVETGHRKAGWQFQRGGHGCGTVSASASAFFFRAGNPTLRDLETGVNHKVTAVSRPGCWINMIPAGGLLLIPEASSGCTCDFPIQSSITLISASLTGAIELVSP